VKRLRKQQKRGAGELIDGINPKCGARRFEKMKRIKGALK